jgi:hypothetical protein
VLAGLAGSGAVVPQDATPIITAAMIARNESFFMKSR